MNDVRFSLNVLDEIYEEARRDDMTLAERAGLYAAAMRQCDNFRCYINDRQRRSSYMLEKTRNYEWHIAAALGFDITNGHDKDQHLSWALGAFWSLRDTLKEAGACEE